VFITSRRRAREDIGVIESTPSRAWSGWAARKMPATSTRTRIATPETVLMAIRGAIARARPASDPRFCNWSKISPAAGEACKRAWNCAHAPGSFRASWWTCSDICWPKRKPMPASTARIVTIAVSTARPSLNLNLSTSGSAIARITTATTTEPKMRIHRFASLTAPWARKYTPTRITAAMNIREIGSLSKVTKRPPVEL
jgi:hypothetical protein